MRYSGDGVDRAVPEPADEARRRAPHLRNDGRALGDVRLAQVVGGHRPAPAREHPLDAGDHFLVDFEWYAEHLGDRLPGDVVLGWTEPPATDQGLATSQGLADGGDDADLVVTHLDLEVGVDAGEGQLFADPG